MSDYFDSTKFVGDAFELVFKNLTENGKKYQKDIQSNKVLQRFIVDFTIIIEQTIKMAVEKEENKILLTKVEDNINEIKKRLESLEPPKLLQDDPMVN